MARRERRVALLICGASAASLFSVLFLDRPAAAFAHGHFAGVWFFVALTHIVDPVLPLALVGFLVLGGGRLFGWLPVSAFRVAFAVCVATMLAVITKDQLKFAFGRTWPETWVNANPSLIHDGVMLFAPFHGGQGWASFPSGHTTLATSPMATLILALRTPWRWLCSLPIMLVALGLWGADYHYVGDMLAGLVVGTLCAAIVVANWPAGQEAR